MIGLAIRRPVAVTMAYVGVALLGVAAWRNIPIELLPDTELPRLTISASWPGSSPEAMEGFVTAPLEGAVQQVRGVERITSRSEEDRGLGRATIEVEFARNVDMDFARLDLSERLQAIERDLPEGLIGPTVEPYVPREFEDQNEPFLQYTVTGPYTLEALRQHVDDAVAPEILQVDGVADLRARGGRERLVEIEFREDQLEALGLNPQTVRRQVRDLEYVSEAGLVWDDGMLRSLAIRQRAGSADDIRRLVLLSDAGRVVRVSDVALVRDTYEDYQDFYRIDGLPAIAFVVLKGQGTNTVAVADAVKARLDEIAGIHPPRTRFILDYDESEAIRAQLTDLRERAVVAALVIFAVLLLFLQSFRSAGIIFATIAFSVLIALNLIYFAGFTLNVLTLMGIAMGFGLIVDNAIVVLENVYRRRRSGLPAREAAATGAREVVLPILAATMTTLIVFIPFVYLQDELRVYYVPLAIVVGLSLVASLLVAFTFIPSVGARLLATLGAAGAGGADRADDENALYVRAYGGLVRFTTRHPWMTVLVVGGAFYGSWRLFDENVSRGTLWGALWGQDSYIQIVTRLPRGAELNRTDELTRFFEDRLRAMPEVDRFVSRVFPEYSVIRVTFPDALENTGIPEAIKEQLLAYSLTFGGAEVRVYGYGPSFYGGGGSPPTYSIKILGYNYERVREIAEDVKRRLERFSRVRDVDINAGGSFFFGEKASEVVLDLDRERLAMYGITPREAVFQVQANVAGRTSTDRIRVGGEEVGFELKVEGYRELDVLDLAETLLRSSDGARTVRLGDVVRIEQRDVLNVILREDQQYQRTVRYEFRGPQKLGDRIRDVVMASTDVPDGYQIEGQQSWSWSDDERRQIFTVLAVALGLIFMVTAALFESLRQPVAVLLTVPMALIGVFLLFFYTEASFTREAYIGVIMMFGIVVNNAILLVDHINRVRRSHQWSLGEAVLRGTLERVRPILMTSTTTILGLLPLVIFSETANANIWNALAYALIGGLLSSTVLVLTVTPALYVIFEQGSGIREASFSPIAPDGGGEPVGGVA